MKPLHIWSSLITAGLILSGCNSDNNDAPVQSMQSYKVTVKNLTFAQPMSPMAVSYHKESTTLFMVGSMATVGLEYLAEGGDNSSLLSELSSNDMVVASIGGNGLILLGQSDSVIVEGEVVKCISIATMLVNTNDAFTGRNCIDVTSLAVGETLMTGMPSYDAGTEANSEEASTIPGPAGGGEGFNTLRDDRDFVSIHSGAVTKDDGLTTSVLSQDHKWSHPTASVIIERIK